MTPAPRVPATFTTGPAAALPWQAMSGRQKVSLILIFLVMAISGVGHFVAPGGYVRIVPAWMPAPRATVYLSGVAELACAGLMAVPRTRRLGAWLTLVVLLVVFPANLQVAIDGDGYPFGEGFLGSNAFAWARLPFQALFAWWAWNLTRQE